MSRTMFQSTAVLALASIGIAQNAIAPHQFGTAPTYPIPTSYWANNNGLTGNNWRTTAARTQTVYDSTVFTAQGCSGPITITELKYRAGQGVVNAGGATYTGVNVQMSTSPVAHTAMSTTFSANRGADNAVVFTGNVTTTACLGGTPNNYVIDIVLTTPFVYDPTSGSDLNIEFDHPIPTTPAGVPTMASAATAGFIDGAQSMRAGSTTATTGTSSPFAPVVWIVFTGPGGTATIDISDNNAYGTSCNYNFADSWYENFPGNGAGHTFDLRGTASTVNSILAVQAGGNWAVAPGSNAWFTPTGSRLLVNSASPVTPMGEDSLSVACTLPFTFSFPGGSTSTVHAASNGYVVLANLGTSSTTSDFTPSSSDLAGIQLEGIGQGTHANTPRLFPLWFDFNCSKNTIPLGALASGIYFDTDAPNGVAYLTWVDVGEFSSAANTAYNNFQVAIFANGSVEFRYGRCDLLSPAAAENAITGISKGRNGTVPSTDPGSRDISATMPFVTNGPDVLPLLMTVPAFGFLNENRPLIGQTLNLQMANVPVSAGFAVRIVSFAAVVPGLELSGQGMAGCFQNVGLLGAATDFFFGGTTIAAPFAIPNSTIYVGNVIFTQSVTLLPGINALGIISSNGMRHVIGVF